MLQKVPSCPFPVNPAPFPSLWRLSPRVDFVCSWTSWKQNPLSVCWLCCGFFCCLRLKGWTELQQDKGQWRRSGEVRCSLVKPWSRGCWTGRDGRGGRQGERAGHEGPRTPWSRVLISRAWTWFHRQRGASEASSVYRIPTPHQVYMLLCSCSISSSTILGDI